MENRCARIWHIIRRYSCITLLKQKSIYTLVFYIFLASRITIFMKLACFIFISTRFTPSIPRFAFISLPRSLYLYIYISDVFGFFRQFNLRESKRDPAGVTSRCQLHWFSGRSRSREASVRPSKFNSVTLIVALLRRKRASLTSTPVVKERSA